MAKKKVLAEATTEDEKLQMSVRKNEADVVEVRGRKFKVRWMHPFTTEWITSLMLKDGNDAKVVCQASALIALNGYWKAKFLYWIVWRWFYYIRQYDNIQLDAILDVGKKKVPLMQYYRTIMSLTEAKDSLMRMRAKEVEATLQELSMAQHSQTESSGNGS